MQLYKNLPIYKVVVDGDYDDTEELGMTTISLVESPAVEVSYEMFEKEEKQINFSLEEEGVIFGVAIRCGMPIYRNGGISGKPYYVVFEKDQIKKIVERYSQKQRWNNVSLQHNGTNIDGLVMNSFFIKDKEKGIDPKGFEHIEDGSLFVSYKVIDNSLWTELKHSDLTGFSIEIASYLDIIETDATEYEKEEPEDELETFVNNIFIEEDSKKKINELEFVSEQKINSLKKGENKVNITIDGETQVAQMDDIYKMNGNKYLAYYIWDPDGINGKWQFLPLVDIEDITKTDIPKEDMGKLKALPSWKGIQEIIDDTTEKRINRDDYVSLIDEGIWCTINYFNPPDGGYTTARQAVLLAYGTTKKGYPCLRIYEKFGTSKSVALGEDGAEIPDYRLLRIDRIINLRPIEYMEHCTDKEVDSWGRYNWGGDRSMSTVYHNRTKKS